jgi:hypothetical protein
MAMVSLANANIVTYTISFDDSYSGSFNINKVLSVPQFNPSQGTLLNVTIDSGVSANGTIGFENTTPNPLVDGELYTYFYWEDPVTHSTHGTLALKLNSATIADVAWDVREMYTLNLSAFDGTIDFAGTSGFSTTYLNQSDSGNLYYDSDLSAFIGGSNVTFNLVGSAYSAMVMPGNGSGQTRTLGQGDVTITYEYTPEPATIALLGLGALSLLKRRRA